MAKFNFHQDEVKTIYKRYHYSVEAETYEEAVELLKSKEGASYWELENECDGKIELNASELLEDTLETPEEEEVTIFDSETYEEIFCKGNPFQ